MFHYRRDPKLESKILERKILDSSSFEFEWILKYKPLVRYIVMDFINTILYRFPNTDLSILYQNLPSLIIKVMSEKNPHYGLDVGYYSWENKIECVKEKPDAIYHELFHAASFVKEGEDIGRVGFRQRNGHFDFGKALNEGYTAFLDELLFGHTGCYFNEKYLVGNIFKTGGDRTNDFYFGADLKGFTQYIGKYSSQKSTLDFVAKMDYIFFKTYLLAFFFSGIRRECLDLYYECIVFTLSNYIVKLLFDLESNHILVSNAQEKLNSMFETIPNTMIICNKNYPIPHVDDLRAHIPDISHITGDDIARYKLVK